MLILPTCRLRPALCGALLAAVSALPLIALAQERWAWLAAPHATTITRNPATLTQERRPRAAAIPDFVQPAGSGLRARSPGTSGHGDLGVGDSGAGVLAPERAALAGVVFDF